MPTPHIDAPPGAFADVVLMPGDPRRARHVASTFLDDPQQVTAVRAMEGWTGRWQGRRVSVMAHGIGIPSCSIYATELVREYGATTLIRIGSCGSLRADVPLHSLVIALGACTDSKVNRIRFRGHDFAAVADFGLARAAADAAAELGTPAFVGSVLSSDLFYSPEVELFDAAERLGVLAVEMEVAGLYGVAAELGVRALGLLTVSDVIRTDEHLPADERATGFDAMVRVALATALAA
ncbi:MAG: purine-nucleoside phosphorylase [Actinobacteria bacterium]|nr:purine-nucleoside phosphorylase [Actinomycetota bacterium]